MSDDLQEPELNSPASPLTNQKLRAEIRNLQALTRQANAQAKSVEAQLKESSGKRSFWERVLSTTQFTIILALFTLIFQIVQFGYTARQSRIADEDKQWKEAVRNISFDGDSKAVVGGALDLETFFDSNTYGGDSRKLVAALLPFVKDNNAFDHLFVTLLNHDDWAEPRALVYTVAKSVSVAYGELADPIYHDSPLPIAAQGRFRRELSTVMMDSMSESSPSVVGARQREWEIDTITRGLVDFWTRNGTRPPDATNSYSADLQTIIIRLDDDALVVLHDMDFTNAYFKGAYLHNVDFSGSNLSSAKLIETDLGSAKLNRVKMDYAVLDGADLDQVTEFSNSSWKGVEWWKAAQLSPSLCNWLGKNGEASGLPGPPQRPPACQNQPASVTAASVK